MDRTSSDVSMWLRILNKHNKETISFFSHEFGALRKLAPVEIVRVIKTPEGDPRLFFIDRLKTIQLLKTLYAFHTKEEASQQLGGMLES